MTTMRCLLLLLALGWLCWPLSTHAIDLDGDGMSDVWQQKYSVPSTDAGLDYTGGGLTNVQKSQLGYDPRAQNLFFRVTQLRDVPNSELHLFIDTVVGKRYQIEQSTNLANWAAVGDAVTGDGGRADVVSTLRSYTPAFFHARLIGEVDSDGDGLAAWEEQQLGTSDNSSDTDEDGVSDSFEFSGGTSPTDYFNGVTPSLAIASGDSQVTGPNQFAAAALVVSVNDSSLNYALVGAPVTFSVSSGDGQLQASSSSLAATSITVKSDSEGHAKVYLKLPNLPDHVTYVTVTTGNGSHVAQLQFIESSDDGSQDTYPSPFAPSNVFGYVNADGSEDITWQNNTDDTGPITISRQLADGTWQVIDTVPAGTTSYHASPQ